jgi:uncharacterized membrane protein YcfT
MGCNSVDYIHLAPHRAYAKSVLQSRNFGINRAITSFSRRLLLHEVSWSVSELVTSRVGYLALNIQVHSLGYYTTSNFVLHNLVRIG